MKLASLLRTAFRGLALAGLTVAAASAQIVIDDPIPVPAFSPAPGDFVDSLAVAMATGTPGASIYYTLDGSIPTVSSPRYVSPIRITMTTTLKALAVKNAQRSAVVTAVYTKVVDAVATPVASPPGRFLDWSGDPLTITLSTTTPGATLYYTLDGSNPGPGGNSRVYTAPFVIAEPTVLKAVAIKWGQSPSLMLVETYTFPDPLPISSPMVSPAGMNFVDSIHVALTVDDTAARLYFTLDGRNPDAGSTRYTAPFILMQSTTVKAVAIRGGRQSAVVTQRYERVTTGIRSGNASRASRASRFHPRWAWQREGRSLDGARR